MAESSRDSRPRRRFWRPRASLTTRILAVNAIALALMAGSLFYLDSYRNQLVAERFGLARAEAQIAAAALAQAGPRKRRLLIAEIGVQQKLRLRLFQTNDGMFADSFALAPPAFQFADPEKEAWYLQAARSLDRSMDFVLGTPPIPEYAEPSESKGTAWPEVLEARLLGVTSIRQRLAPDRTPVITAAVPVGNRGEVLLTTRNAIDITQRVRDARQTLALIVGAALLTSILLSLFLARTIVQPLRELVRAAVRVRAGRDREVVVPRLPDRGDEIGLLARAVSDMTAALRQRIDAVESFAADVAHELKNPLASLRSALESLDKVKDAKLRGQLARIAAHDVQRIDRLVTEIADASRIDAELSRTTFEPIDMARLIKALTDARRQSGVDGLCEVSLTLKGKGPWLVAGDILQLQRVIDNLLDNAVSFSPPGGKIAIDLRHDDGNLEIAISDQGPGIPAEAREKVFERFHSLRPDTEDFGNHSGLGLAIARTIVQAHDGTLDARDRTDGAQGACLIVTLPALASA
ncbi:MAG: ATP-binding protein [Novosphingobium sp.]